VALGAGGAGIAEASFVAPFHPVLEEITVRLPLLPPAFDGFRIALLSDLHVQIGFPAACLAPAIDMARRAAPDLILYGGDYRYDHQARDRDDRPIRECAMALQPLSALSPAGGPFAVYGNHDYPQPPAQPDPGLWRAIGVTPLRETVAEIARKGDRLFLIGMDSLIARPTDPAAHMAALPHGACAIALWHEPDWADRAAAAGVSLQLSGHTHGGQVVIPGIGAPVLPDFGRKYPSGWFDVAGMPLYVTRGVGLLPPLVRVNCPPEVTLLTLRCGGPAGPAGPQGARRSAAVEGTS
jgi:hypothetical protein